MRVHCTLAKAAIYYILWDPLQNNEARLFPTGKVLRKITH